MTMPTSLKQLLRRAATSCTRYPWAPPLAWVLAGWIGAQTVLPGPRVSRVEAQIARQDTSHLAEIQRLWVAHNEHLRWASQVRDTIRDDARATRLDLEAFSRAGCMRAKRQRDDVEWDLLVGSGVRCNQLLGNRVAAR